MTDKRAYPFLEFQLFRTDDCFTDIVDREFQPKFAYRIPIESDLYMALIRPKHIFDILRNLPLKLNPKKLHLREHTSRDVPLRSGPH
jgi:hypothetical protein